MFTPSMTEEEIQQAAYKDYLEIRTRVQIAFERFGQSMRISGKHKRAIHSLSESHTLCTRAKNTWNVNFRYTGYTPDGQINIVCYLYIPLRRENGVDYLFMNDPKCFKVERVSSHFLQRYKERYLDPAGIDLKGVHPAIYFMQNNEDRRQAYYLPKNSDRRGVGGEVLPCLEARPVADQAMRENAHLYYFSRPREPEPLQGASMRGGGIPASDGEGKGFRYPWLAGDQQETVRGYRAYEESHEPARPAGRAHAGTAGGVEPDVGQWLEGYLGADLLFR